MNIRIEAQELACCVDLLRNITAEFNRYLVGLKKIEEHPSYWDAAFYGTGIATSNGYCSKLDSLKSVTDKLQEVLETGREDLVDHQLIKDQYEIIKAQRELLREAGGALSANRVFHTPFALRKLRNGEPWDEYQTDAINRTQRTLSLLESAV